MSIASRLRPWRVVACGAAAVLAVVRPYPAACAPAGSQDGTQASATGENSRTRFSDIAAEVGITFHHDNAKSPQKLLIETMGAGCAWLDYNRDGHLDAFFVNSGPTVAYRPNAPLSNALYRNNGDGTFTDVTADAGLAGEEGFGMGVVVGDYDNDGFPDLYVTGTGESKLYHNEGNERFLDVTQSAGVANSGMWGTSGAFFDYDNDGLLDLMVINYLDWSPGTNTPCETGGPGTGSYCHPRTYQGLPARLYRNTGGGVFEDRSETSGIGQVRGRGLGLVCFDSNDDGLVDVYAANDAMENFLWKNNGDGTFTDVALELGVAFNEDGLPEASMGVHIADLNHDGRQDLFVTHYHYELNRLYMSAQDGSYSDATVRWGLAQRAQRTVGFGTWFLDFDSDGLQDIGIVNGHVIDNIDLVLPKVTHAEPREMYRNTGGGFVDVSEAMGKEFTTRRVGRGLAVADFDNDGDPDLLVSNNGGPAELLRNDSNEGNHWLGLRLIGTRSNRDGIGTKITLRAGEWVRHFQVTGGGSYLSASDPRLLIGLGQREKVDTITVRWPTGVVQTVMKPALDQYHTITELF